MNRPDRFSALCLAFTLTALSITGCASNTPTTGNNSTASTSVTEAENKETPSEDSTPIVIKNCGKELEFKSRPEKVVSLGVTGLAYLVAAGAQDKIVARANEFGEPPAEWIGNKADNIKIAADFDIAMESIIGMKPDLVYGGGFSSSNLSAEAVKEKGIPAFVDAPECHYFYTDAKPDESFDSILNEVTQLGDLLGTEQVAKQTVSDLKSQIQTLKDKHIGKGQTVSYAYYFGEDNDLFSYGNEGVMADINSTLDLKVAIDSNYHPHQGPLSPEAFVKSDPDVIIVLLGMGGATKEGTMKKLEAIPGFKEMKAVQNKKIYFGESAIAYAAPTALYGTLELAKEMEN